MATRLSFISVIKARVPSEPGEEFAEIGILASPLLAARFSLARFSLLVFCYWLLATG